MAEKLFYSMGEVAEMFDVNASLIRHWAVSYTHLDLYDSYVKGRGIVPRLFLLSGRIASGVVSLAWIG